MSTPIYYTQLFAHNTTLREKVLRAVLEDQWENGNPLVTFPTDKVIITKGVRPAAYLKGPIISIGLSMQECPTAVFTQDADGFECLTFSVRFSGQIVVSELRLIDITEIRDRTTTDGSNATVFYAVEHRGMVQALTHEPLAFVEHDGEALQVNLNTRERISMAPAGLKVVKRAAPASPDMPMAADTPPVPDGPVVTWDELMPNTPSDFPGQVAMTAGDPKRVIDDDALQAGLASGKVVDLNAWKAARRS